MKLSWVASVAGALTLVAGCVTDPPTAAEPPVSDKVLIPAWAESGPSPADFLRVYPPKALRLEIESQVHLKCTIRDDRRLDCTPIWEEYADLGFGAAAVTVSRLFVVRADYSPDAQPGSTVTVPITFVLSD